MSMMPLGMFLNSMTPSNESLPRADEARQTLRLNPGMGLCHDLTLNLVKITQTPHAPPVPEIMCEGGTAFDCHIFLEEAASVSMMPLGMFLSSMTSSNESLPRADEARQTLRLDPGMGFCHDLTLPCV